MSQPAAKQTQDARILGDYRNAVTTPHPNGGYRPDCCPAPTPSPTPLTGDAAVHPCAANDLRAAWHGSDYLTGGEISASIALGNTSHIACRLSVPGVQLIGPSNLLTTLGPGYPCKSGSVGPCVFTSPVLMLPDRGTLATVHHSAGTGTATLEFTWWINDRANGCSTIPTPATAVRIVLPDGGGVLDVPVGDSFPRSSGPHAVTSDDTIAPCGDAYVVAFSGVP